MAAMIRTIEWTDAGVVMIDQRRLPTEEVYNTYRVVEEVAEAIDFSKISILNLVSEFEGKESNKYTFTLFSFFTRNNEETKTDSVNTNSKTTKPKLKQKLN